MPEINRIKQQHVNEQIYPMHIFTPNGTKIGAEIVIEKGTPQLPSTLFEIPPPRSTERGQGDRGQELRR